MKKYYFISGLPRSGSTLLSSILKQNPKFTASISDPLHSYVRSIISSTNLAVGMEAAVSIEKRRNLIRSLFDSFYESGNEVCFNTNRAWCADTALLKDLYPDFKMIVCLREIPWILDSFEKLNSKNPYSIKPLYHHQDLNNVYERSNILMGQYPNFGGYVSVPLDNTKTSMFCAEKNQICFVEYDTLAKHPLATLRQIYNFLGEPWFEHDFNNVEDSYDEFDEQAKISGLHTVRKRVEFINRETVIPNDLWEKYNPLSFWKFNFENVKRSLNWINIKINTVGKQL